MRRNTRWILIVMLIAVAARVSAYTVPYEAWLGAYVGEKKIGYMSYKIDKADINGVSGYRIDSVLSNRLSILGAELTQLVTTVIYTDTKSQPIKEDFAMSSGGKTTRVISNFKKDVVECEISAGSGSSKKTVPIPSGATLVGDPMFAVPSPEVGRKYSFHYFDPLSLAVSELTVNVEREEKLKIGDKEYDTFVMKSASPLGNVTVWQEKNGDVVQAKGIMGITLTRQSRTEAMAGIGEGPSQDLAILTSVKSNKKIPSARSVQKLDVILKGLSCEPIKDIRQSVISDKIEGEKRLCITARSFDSTKSAVLPIGQADMATFLASTPYIDSDQSAVQTQAREIVGEEKNAYLACTKIRAWVNANLQTRANIGITRSGSDVLKSKVGVCRDYAILFASLARSAGIPTRIAAGLVYLEGSFYYHAWDECYVGEWTPFDATLPTDFVDATHIKLAEGDATCMFGLSKVIGSLKADVKSFK